MLLHRYHNVEYILQTDVNIGASLILKALEKDREERIFQQWVAQLPVMAIAGEAVSFADYKNRVTGANIDCRPATEIMSEIDEIERQLEEGGNANGT